MKKLFLFGFYVLMSTLILKAQTFSGGSGSPNDPYQITKRADLDTLSSRVNAKMDFGGMHFKLMNDIDLGGAATVWKPIGSYTSSSNNAPFKGNFDGNNKTISNMVIQSPTVDYQGFFGYVKNDAAGSIQNLHIIKSSVAGKSYVGGIAGRSNVPITNCSFNGTIKGVSTTGGIVGDNGTGKGGVVAYCFTSGFISGGSTGGIVGSANDTVRYCYSTATVQGTASTGGIIASGNTIVVHDSYFAGTVMGETGSAFAIVGGRNLNGNGAENIMPASVNTHYDKQMNPTGGRAMLDNAGDVITDENTNAGRMDGYLTTAMLGEGLKSKLGTVNWIYEAGLYPRLTMQTNSSAVKLAITPILLNANNTARSITDDFTLETKNGIVWTTETENIIAITAANAAINRSILTKDTTFAIKAALDGNERALTLTVLSNTFELDFSSTVVGGKVFVYKNGTPVAPKSQVSIGSMLTVVTTNEDGYMPKSAQYEVGGIKKDILNGSFEFTGATKLSIEFTPVKPWDGSMKAITDGSGTTSDPYYIYCPEELAWLADACNKGDKFASKYFRLMNNIDLNGAQYSWTPIGKSSTLSFNGYFQGNRKTISNMKVNETSEFAGFFGYITAGGAKELFFENAEVKGTNHVGGVAGQNTANAELLSYSGSVSGDNNVGGIFGTNSATTVKTLSFSGSLTGKACVGGIIGYTSGTNNNTLFSVGTITGDSCVGGLIGHNTMRNINDAYSAASVKGGIKVGGILGSTNAVASGVITRSFFTGRVECSRDTMISFGAICGTQLTAGGNTKNYYDKQLNPALAGTNNENVDGKFEGRLSKELLGEALQTLTGSTEYVYTEGLYPRNKYYDATHAALNLAAAPVQLWVSEDGLKMDNADSIRENFVLSTLNGVEWSAEPTTAVTIEGSQAKIHPSSENIDFVLRASLGGKTKMYNLTLMSQAVNKIEGTQSVCAGDSATLSLFFVGVPPFTYRLNGDTENRIALTKESTTKVLPSETKAYKVTTLSDANGVLDISRMDSAVVTTIARPTATFGEDFVAEIGEPAAIPISFTGTAPFTYKITGDFLNRKAYQNDTVLMVDVQATTTYKVTSLSDNVCTAKSNTLTDQITITLVPVAVLLPPHGMVGKVFADEVQLSWKAPTSLSTLQWCRNYAYDALPSGSGNFPSTWAGVLFEASDLLEYKDMKIDTIGFYPYHPIMKMKVHFYEDDVLVSTEEMDISKLVYKGERDTTEPSLHFLNKLGLKKPYVIKAGKNVRMAFEYQHGGNSSQFIACVDQNPAIKGKGDLMSTDKGETWVSSGKGNNVMVAYIADANRDQSAKTPAAYNVYRGTTKINTELVRTNTFIAKSQPVGLQTYTVKSVDAKGSESANSFAVNLTISDPNDLRGAPIQLVVTDTVLNTKLSWKAPIANTTKLSWINPELSSATSSVGFTGSAPKATVVNYFGPEELANLNGAQIDAINVFFTSDSLKTLKLVIYQNDELVYEDTVINIPAKGSWAKIQLKTPYIIQAGKSLHYGYFMTHHAKAKPIGLDYSLCINGRSNVTSPNEKGGAWNTLLNMNEDLKASWMLFADISGAKNTPAVSAYDIYRNGAKLKTTANLTETDIVPAPATYTYTVKANYADAKTSDFSAPATVVIGIPDDYPAPSFTKSYTNMDTVLLEWGASSLSNQLKWHTEAKYNWSLRNDGNDVDFSVGAGFNKNDLLPYLNHEITGVDIVIADDVFSIDVVVVIENEIVATAKVTDFKTFEVITTNFDKPFKIPANKDVIVGYHIVHEDGMSPIVLDDGPNVPGKGDLFNLASVDGDKRWFAFSSLPNGFKYNFVIAANVREVGSTNAPTKLTKSNALLTGNLTALQAMPMPKTEDLANAKTLAKAQPKGESIIGYNMYRNGKKQNADLLTETKYMDTKMDAGKYTYNVSAVYANNWESNLSTPFTYKYYKPNLLPAPRNLENTGDTNVKLSWKAPMLSNRIKWAKDTAQMTIGFTGSTKVNAWILNKFSPSDLAAYPNAKITYIRFDLLSAQLLTLKVGVFYGDMLIYQQEVNDWQVGTNMILLNTPVPVDPNLDLMIGYWAEYNTGIKPHAMDYGPALEGKGNVVSTNDGYSFKTLTSMNPNLKYNWVVSAYLESDASETISGTKGSPVDSVIVYKVYRNGAMVKDNIFTLSYVAPKPTENANYYVTAVYGSQAEESGPSNSVFVTKNENDTIIANEIQMNKGEFRIYPNPAANYIYFSAEQIIKQLEIYDIQGRLLRVLRVNEEKGSVDISNLRTGTYYIRMIGISDTKTAKLIKN